MLRCRQNVSALPAQGSGYGSGTVGSAGTTGSFGNDGIGVVPGAEGTVGNGRLPGALIVGVVVSVVALVVVVERELVVGVEVSCAPLRFEGGVVGR